MCFSYVWFGNRQIDKQNKQNSHDRWLLGNSSMKTRNTFIVRKNMEFTFSCQKYAVHSCYGKLIWKLNVPFIQWGKKNTPLVFIFKQQQDEEEGKKCSNNFYIFSSLSERNWLINFIDENQLNLFFIRFTI